MLSKRLIELRTEKGLTQQDIADKLNIVRSTYAQYEISRREPDLDTLKKIADYFKVSVDWLLGRTDQRELLTEPNQNTNINKSEINLDDLQVAAHDESGKIVPASEGLKNLIKDVLQEIAAEKRDEAKKQ